MPISQPSRLIDQLDEAVNTTDANLRRAAEQLRTAVATIRQAREDARQSGLVAVALASLDDVSLARLSIAGHLSGLYDWCGETAVEVDNLAASFDEASAALAGQWVSSVRAIREALQS